MTDKPTDAELKAMWQLHAADIGGIFYYARAVLAKWGTPAPMGTATTVDHHSLVAAHLVHMGHGEGACGTKRFSHGIRSAEQPAQSSAAADTVVLEAALRAIHQAIDLIGEPDTERLRTVRRVLRGAVVVAEDCKAPQADSQPAPSESQQPTPSPAPATFLRGVIDLCTQKGFSPENIEAWDSNDKWIADIWRQARELLAAPADSVLYDPKAVLEIFNSARNGSDKPVGYMRGILAVIAHWESRPEPHRWMVPARADSVLEDAARLDWIAVRGSFGVDSATGEVGGNGQKQIAATRKNIDAALAAQGGKA